MRHNANEYTIYAIREDATTAKVLRSIIPFVKFFNKASNKPIAVVLYSQHTKRGRENIKSLEAEYRYSLDPVFLVEPNRNVIDAGDILDFVRDMAVSAPASASMSEHSPLGKLQQRPPEQSSEIDTMIVQPNNDYGTTAPRSTVPRPVKSAKEAKPAKGKDNWNPGKGGGQHYETPVNPKDQKLINRYVESSATSDLSEEINNYFKKPGKLLNEGMKY